jgi:hypothetical protein
VAAGIIYLQELLRRNESLGGCETNTYNRLSRRVFLSTRIVVSLGKILMEAYVHFYLTLARHTQISDLLDRQPEL